MRTSLLTMLVRLQKHPYYDAKSSADAPRWFMVHSTASVIVSSLLTASPQVDVQFVSELPHFVPLALLQDIAALPAKDARRNDIDYLSDAHLEALKTMQLLTRGRLSVVSWMSVELRAQRC
jgi:predicted RNA-binding protein with PUA-like domain